MTDVFDLADYYASHTTSTGKWQSATVPISTSDVGHNSKTVLPDTDEANNTLSFQDMLMLMVTQLQNQTIDNTADTNDMMNQIIQMTVMQAITDMKTHVDENTEANILAYSASLVGQTVTVGIVDKNGYLVGEKVGVVTATGTYNGQRVVYMGDEYFPINQILAVGVLPADRTESGNPDDGDENVDGDKPVDGTDETGKTDETGTDGGTDANLDEEKAEGLE